MSEGLEEDQYHIMVIQVKGPLTKEQIQDYVEAVQDVLDLHNAEVQRTIRVLKPRQD
jgi:hypothetical protein